MVVVVVVAVAAVVALLHQVVAVAMGMVVVAQRPKSVSCRMWWRCTAVKRNGRPARPYGPARLLATVCLFVYNLTV